MAVEVQPNHCIVTWDVYTTDEAEATVITAELRRVLKGRSWVRPLTHPFFIVRVRDPLDRNELKQALVAVCKAHPRAVRLLVGPVQQGSYGGWVARDMWPKIRKRTENLDG